MEIQLTHDADVAICVIYRHYLERVEKGEPKRNATSFIDTPLNVLFPGWDEQDSLSVIYELGNAGLIRTYMRGSFSLETKGIIYMESRFSRKLSRVLEYLGKFKGAVPFL